MCYLCSFNFFLFPLTMLTLAFIKSSMSTGSARVDFRNCLINTVQLGHPPNYVHGQSSWMINIKWPVPVFTCVTASQRFTEKVIWQELGHKFTKLWPRYFIISLRLEENRDSLIIRNGWRCLKMHWLFKPLNLLDVKLWFSSWGTGWFVNWKAWWTKRDNHLPFIQGSIHPVSIFVK